MAVKAGLAPAGVPTLVSESSTVNGYSLLEAPIRGVEDAELVARRLLLVLSQPYRIGVHEVHSSASIGVVTSTRI